MKALKVIAFVNILIVGLFGLGTLAVVVGYPWTTVCFVWLGVWVVVAILAEMAEPSSYD